MQVGHMLLTTFTYTTHEANWSCAWAETTYICIVGMVDGCQLSWPSGEGSSVAMHGCLRPHPPTYCMQESHHVHSYSHHQNWWPFPSPYKISSILYKHIGEDQCGSVAEKTQIQGTVAVANVKLLAKQGDIRTNTLNVILLALKLHDYYKF